MAWEVAIAVSPISDYKLINTLASYMPIWIINSPSNGAWALEARRTTGEMWAPDPAYTTFDSGTDLSPEEIALGIAPSVDLHHAHLAKLNLIGVKETDSLRLGMQKLGFVPAETTWECTIAFRKPVSELPDVPHLTLDACKWRTSDDVYESLFCALGSPAWHGKNFNALHDSIVTGQINTLNVPFILHIKNLSSFRPEVRTFVQELMALISRFEIQGCPVAIQIDNE